MTAVLQVSNRTITAEEVIPLLADYQILPQLLREIIIDQAIAPFTCTPEEKANTCRQFYAQRQLTSQAEQQAWLERYGMTPKYLEALATRGLRIEKFKQATWRHKLEAYFLQRKGKLDRVIYSLIRTQDTGVARELYFRIQEGEQSFAELAREYSQGLEAHTGGFVGPVELSTLPPALAQRLSVSQPGQLSSISVEGWLMIARLEKFIPAQLNKLTRQRLLNELFTDWLQKQLNQVDSGYVPMLYMNGAKMSASQ